MREAVGQKRLKLIISLLRSLSCAFEYDIVCISCMLNNCVPFHIIESSGVDVAIVYETSATQRRTKPRDH